jgi:hypothetical protein
VKFIKKGGRSCTALYNLKWFINPPPFTLHRFLHLRYRRGVTRNICDPNIAVNASMSATDCNAIRNCDRHVIKSSDIATKFHDVAAFVNFFIDINASYRLQT